MFLERPVPLTFGIPMVLVGVVSLASALEWFRKAEFAGKRLE
jgi:hypothetical protein